MRFRILLTIFSCISIALPSYGQIPQESITRTTKTATGWVNTFELGQGYRHDSLKWSISGRHGKPNILSELDFKDMHMYLSTFDWSLHNETYIAKVHLGYAYAPSGKGTDCDYVGNNRKKLFGKSYSALSHSYNVDSTIQFGRIFSISPSLSLVPSVGYGFFAQKIYLHNTKITYSATRSIPKGKVHGHDSSYRATWSAPFINLLAAMKINPKLTLDIDYSFFFPMQYKGLGFWNLRMEEGQFFRQQSNSWKSFGQKLQAHLKYALTKNIDIGFTAAATYFIANEGEDSWMESRSHHYPFRKAQRLALDGILSLSYAF